METHDDEEYINAIETFNDTINNSILQATNEGRYSCIVKVPDFISKTIVNIYIKSYEKEGYNLEFIDDEVKISPSMCNGLNNYRYRVLKITWIGEDEI